MLGKRASKPVRLKVEPLQEQRPEHCGKETGLLCIRK